MRLWWWLVLVVVVVVQMRGELSMAAIAGQTWSREEGLWYLGRIPRPVVGSRRAASSKVQARRTGSSGSGCQAGKLEGAPLRTSQPANSRLLQALRI